MIASIRMQFLIFITLSITTINTFGCENQNKKSAMRLFILDNSSPAMKDSRNCTGLLAMLGTFALARGIKHCFSTITLPIFNKHTHFTNPMDLRETRRHGMGCALIGIAMITPLAGMIYQLEQQVDQQILLRKLNSQIKNYRDK
jgi:hypothetical protein